MRRGVPDTPLAGILLEPARVLASERARNAALVSDAESYDTRWSRGHACGSISVAPGQRRNIAAKDRACVAESADAILKIQTQELGERVS
jgi:hypothetical protein